MELLRRVNEWRRKGLRVRSPRPTKRTLGHLNQRAQCRIDGLLVGKVPGHVRGKQNEIRPGLVAREVFAANAVLQLRKIVFPAQVVRVPPFLRSFLHCSTAWWRYLLPLAGSHSKYTVLS